MITPLALVCIMAYYIIGLLISKFVEAAAYRVEDIPVCGS